MLRNIWIITTRFPTILKYIPKMAFLIYKHLNLGYLIVIYREWYMGWTGELFMHSQECYFGVYFLSFETMRKMITSITLEWQHKWFLRTVHASFYFLHGMMNPQMMIKEMIITHWHCLIWSIYVMVMTSQLTHWGRDKMDAISQTTFSNAFSWMKMFVYRLKFHWNLFLRVQLTIFRHWFR